MRLISLSVANLYGTLNLDLKFFRDLNLLVGINGSGKTSALSVIDWLLTPNLPKLATQRYDRLTLALELEGKFYEIISERSDKVVLIQLQCGFKSFEPVSIKIDPNEPMHENERFFQGLAPEDHEKETWNFLQNLKKPTVVSLERTLTAEVDDEIYYEHPRNRSPYENSRARSRRTAGRRSTPLEYVQEIFSQKYAEYRYLARQNDARLKSQIILTALHSPDSEDPPLRGFQIPLQSTQQLEQKVKGYLSTSIPSQNVESKVERFFSYFRSLSEEVEKSADKSGKVLDLIQSQFSRVEQLASAFNEFEESNARAFSRVSKYLESVNLFLKDSKKTLSADDSRGKLVFYELADGEPAGAARSISKLSSGESQIIILLALMAFESSESSVFIVDEPELSLHPKWQSEFMQSFLGLCPEKSQILVATHSPEIVAGHKRSCVFF